MPPSTSHSTIQGAIIFYRYEKIQNPPLFCLSSSWYPLYLSPHFLSFAFSSSCYALHYDLWRNLKLWLSTNLGPSKSLVNMLFFLFFSFHNGSLDWRQASSAWMQPKDLSWVMMVEVTIVLKLKMLDTTRLYDTDTI